MQAIKFSYYLDKEKNRMSDSYLIFLSIYLKISLEYYIHIQRFYLLQVRRYRVRVKGVELLKKKKKPESE